MVFQALRDGGVMGRAGNLDFDELAIVQRMGRTKQPVEPTDSQVESLKTRWSCCIHRPTTAFSTRTPTIAHALHQSSRLAMVTDMLCMAALQKKTCGACQ